jgi:rhodanese-related sulfurtransferase
MDVHEAAALLERGEGVAIDVREPREWQAGRMPGSRHVPLGELGARIDELPRATTIVAVCRSGNRSALVTRALRDAGFPAENLDGGLQAWTRAGLPLEPSDGRVA